MNIYTLSSNIKRAVLLLAVAGMLLGSVFMLPQKAEAQMTMEEMQAEINRLTALVEQLVLLLNLQNGGTVTPPSPTSPNPACPYTWMRDLQFSDTGADVQQLQRFLNHDPETQLAVSGIGSPGQESSFYGELLSQAVSKFQVKYRSEVLSPLGLVDPTGVFGPAARAHANYLCAPAPIPSPTPPPPAPEDGTGSVVIKSSSNDPDSTTFEIDTNDASGYYTIFAFTLENQGSNDVDISEIVLDFAIVDAGEGVDAVDILDVAELYVDGNYSSAHDTYASGGRHIFFTDLYEYIDAGDSVEVEILAKFKSVDSGVVNGTNFSVNVGAVILEGGEQFAATGSAESARHSLYSEGLIFDLVSTDEVLRLYGGSYPIDDAMVYTLEFDLTAFGEDVYIADQVGNDLANEDEAFYFHFYTGSGAPTNDGWIWSATINSSADEDNGQFVVREGDTESFTLEITGWPSNMDSYGVYMAAIRYTAGNDTELQTLGLGNTHRTDLLSSVRMDNPLPPSPTPTPTPTPPPPAPSELPDLTSQVLSVTDGTNTDTSASTQGSALQACSSLWVTTRVANNGNASNNTPFAYRLDVNNPLTSQIRSTRKTISSYSITAGGLRTDNINFGMVDPGNYRVRAIVDVDSEVSEAIESNNVSPWFYISVEDCADSSDMDNDGVLDEADNCPLVANSDQSDRDADGVGDVCDSTPMPTPPPTTNANDAERKEDLQTIAAALHENYADHGTFQVTGTGQHGNGNGWFNLENGTSYLQSVNNGLVAAGYLSQNVIDPSGIITRYDRIDQSGYMIITNAAGDQTRAGQAFTIWANLEEPTAADLATLDRCEHSNYDHYNTRYAEGTRMNYCVSGYAPEAPLLGTYEGYRADGSRGIRTTNISRESALSNCRFNGFTLCTWNGETIYSANGTGEVAGASISTPYSVQALIAEIRSRIERLEALGSN